MKKQKDVQGVPAKKRSRASGVAAGSVAKKRPSPPARSRARAQSRFDDLQDAFWYSVRAAHDRESNTIDIPCEVVNPLPAGPRESSVSGSEGGEAGPSASDDGTPETRDGIEDAGTPQ